jgi:hypothetical protein
LLLVFSFLIHALVLGQIFTRAYHIFSSSIGRQYYAAALFQAPYLSLYSAEQIFPLVVAGFLADAGIAFYSEAVAASCPAVKTLYDMFVDGGVDSLLWLEDQLKDAAAVFIACNKGN